ncbi:transposase [Pseudanabaena sp. ABRG5-3]|nr:transposase [Pseudanabaena sp. ABRG5-3]
MYLLKSKPAITIQEASKILGRHRVTVQEWLKAYRNGGLPEILKHKARVGRQHSIPQWVQQVLDKRLHKEEGFNDYAEICQWLEQQLGIVAKYKTVHKFSEISADSIILWYLL